MEIFEEIKFVLIGDIRPISEADILAAERGLGCKFPSDYRQFVQKYGAGYFSQLPVRVFSPQQILDRTKEDQNRLRDYWFWKESKDVLTHQDGIRSIACFDTDIGHDIRFLPDDPTVMFVLSHDDGSITRCTGFRDIVRLFEPGFVQHVYEFRAFNRA